MDQPEGPAAVGPSRGAGVRTCPACLTDNPPNFLFCQGCGRLLPRSPGEATSTSAVPAPTLEQLQPTLGPISIELVRAARATRYDSDSIRGALATVESASRTLQALTQDPSADRADEYVWERSVELAAASSLIEGAAALLALAAAPETRDNLRGLFVRRAYWVLQVAKDQTQGLLAKGDR